MRHRARAQVLVWVVVMLPLVFLPIIGLSIDAGLLFDARRDVQNVADGAARAGAQRIDTARIGGVNGRMRINKTQAEQTVREYQDKISWQGRALDVHWPSETEIEVVARRDFTPRFLLLLHVDSIPVTATGHAIACQGINTSTCR